MLVSLWPAHSWAVLSPNLLRGFVLPFIALECVRTEQDLGRLGIAFFLAAFGQGLDGIWQYVTGYDLIKETPLMSGRLTGSFGTYRVGNYMGLILAPACLVGLLLPVGSLAARISATACLLAPGLFLWVFAQARMGYLGLCLGLCLALLSVQERFPLRAVAGLLGAAVVLVFFGPDRISLERALADPRGELWNAAWQTFLHTPWFGTGIESFIPALQRAGLTLPVNGLGVQHPHNAYLQFLVDGGLVGFAAMTLFLFGFTFWAWRRIRAGVLAERRLEKAGKNPGFFWRSALFFLAAWLGYLIILAGGHDFYRAWFFSTGMTMLGITAGACLNGPQDV